MRKYELVIIANSELDEDSLKGTLEKVENWITTSGGEIVKVDDWGKRRLAYRIQKQRDGHYILITANMEPSATKEIAGNMRFVENILRYMITLVEDEEEAPAAAAEEETVLDAAE